MKSYTEAYSALIQMGKKVTGQTAFKLFVLKKKLDEVVQFLLEEEKKLIEKYNGIVNENGLIRFEDEKNSESFFKEKAELYGGDYEVEPVEIEIDLVPDVTMEEMIALDGFVVFK